MSKELKALERLYCAGRLDLHYVQSDNHKKDYELIFKELKALEIIKEKKVCVVWLRNGLSAYNSTAALYELPRLTQEEYDLLKEVLL